MSRKEHRAEMRQKHGPEWWTNPSKRRNSGHYGFSAEKTQSKYHRERDLGLYWTLYIRDGRGRARVGLFGTEHDAKNVARLLNEQLGVSPEPREEILLYNPAGWERLEGSALTKARRVTGTEVQYARRFGRKTVFLRDSGLGAYRLRAVGPRGEVYQMKVGNWTELDKWAGVLAHAAKLGEPGEGMYVVSPPGEANRR